MKKLMILLFTSVILFGCDETTTNDAKKDIEQTQEVTDRLSANQPTPTDIEFSLERYNLTKRAYWANGQREKAMSVTSQVPLPIGYIVLFNDNSIVAQFSVEGKVSSLNSYLTPEYTHDYIGASGVRYQKAVSDVDGSFGVNDDGIFFFTVDGKYVEWNGMYLYSDIPMFIEDPIVKLKK